MTCHVSLVLGGKVALYTQQTHVGVDLNRIWPCHDFLTLNTAARKSSESVQCAITACVTGPVPTAAVPLVILLLLLLY